MQLTGEILSSTQRMYSAPERLQSITDAIPLKRMGTTREMAGTCLFLASELSGFVTGATIDVNGGTHIH